jgi:hypothetical protein
MPQVEWDPRDWRRRGHPAAWRLRVVLRVPVTIGSELGLELAWDLELELGLESEKILEQGYLRVIGLAHVDETPGQVVQARQGRQVAEERRAVRRHEVGPPE